MVYPCEVTRRLDVPVHSMLTLDHLEKSFGAHTVLDGVTLRFEAGQVTGLVGPNGAGKTTLLEIIEGRQELDAGAIRVPQDARIGYLPQEIKGEQRSGSLFEVIISGRSDLLELEARLVELEAALEDDPDLTSQYTEARELFGKLGGYVFRSTAREIAVGIGFSPDDLERPIGEFSGGWQMRALLARLLLVRPQVLLLDEPTNHLDLESVEWLERFLKRYEGTVILVSHDRYFLNQLVDEIVELDRGKLTRYHGNYDHFQVEKERRREQLEQLAADQKQEIERIEAFIERFRYQANKAAQVQSRIKMLEKMERVETLPDPSRTMHLEFPQPPRLGKRVIVIEDLHKSFDENTVYSGLDLTLLRGDKVALVGPNGAGKTTLLRMMARELEPDRGHVEYGSKVEVSYFAQHAVEQLDPSRTILEELMAHADEDSSARVRDILGAFLFSNDSVRKRISVLSGGEKSRVALAKILLDPGGLLLLDEPTNHLDISSCQVLEQALAQFKGVVVIVSHDRSFINNVVAKTIHIEDGRATEYLGNYDAYKRKRDQELGAEEEASSADSSEGSLSKKKVRQRTAQLRQKKRQELDGRARRLKDIEESITRLEEKLERNLALLAEPDIYEDPERVRTLNQENKRHEDELEALFEQWESLGSEVEAIEERYSELEAELS